MTTLYNVTCRWYSHTQPLFWHTYIRTFDICSWQNNIEGFSLFIPFPFPLNNLKDLVAEVHFNNVSLINSILGLLLGFNYLDIAKVWEKNWKKNLLQLWTNGRKRGQLYQMVRLNKGSYKFCYHLPNFFTLNHSLTLNSRHDTKYTRIDTCMTKAVKLFKR